MQTLHGRTIASPGAIRGLENVNQGGNGRIHEIHDRYLIDLFPSCKLLRTRLE